ncbi:hypothetical protein N9V83_01545 [Flavobacteriales bacterium]|nr:hypothetical protein [Flavobacteriales bacterium]
MKTLLILFTLSVFLISCGGNDNSSFENEIINVYSKQFVSSEQNDANQEKSWNEKNNSHEEYEKLIQTILNKVYSKELKVYSALDQSNELSSKEIDNILYTSEIIEIEDENGFETNKTVDSKLEAEHITHVEFKENWHYSNQGAIKKTVERIGLYKQSFDERGEVKGLVLIFWVEL